MLQKKKEYILAKSSRIYVRRGERGLSFLSRTIRSFILGTTDVSYEKCPPTCATSCLSALPIRSHWPPPSRRVKRGWFAYPARQPERLAYGGTAPPSSTSSSHILPAQGSGDLDRCHWDWWPGRLNLGRSTNIDPASWKGRRSYRISDLENDPTFSRIRISSLKLLQEYVYSIVCMCIHTIDTPLSKRLRVNGLISKTGWIARACGPPSTWLINISSIILKKERTN